MQLSPGRVACPCLAAYPLQCLPVLFAADRCSARAALARHRPGEALLLQVESNNTAAVELYHQCGFETISHPWCQISLMRRPLRDELGETARQPQRAAHVSKNEHEEQQPQAERDGELPLQRQSGTSVGSVSVASDASSGASADGSDG